MQSPKEIEEPKRTNSPPNHTNVAPSLVERCKDKYQNALYKNFLKKRTGHEYDPLEATRNVEKQ